MPKEAVNNMKEIEVKALYSSIPFENIDSTVIYKHLALHNEYSFLFENLNIITRHFQ